MDHYFVNEPVRIIKSLARQALKPKLKEAIGVYLLMFALTRLPDVLIGALTTNDFIQRTLTIYAYAVTGPLNLGLAFFFLRMSRMEESGPECLFSGFQYWTKALSLYFLKAIKVMLWSLLFVVPGIVASFRYSMAYYVMADHPEYTAAECIEVSKRLMAGNLSKYFMINLSFFPLYFIAALPTGIVTDILCKDIMTGALTMESLQASAAIVSTNPMVELLTVFTFLAGVYVDTTMACFYDLANGNLVVSYQRPGV